MNVICDESRMMSISELLGEDFKKELIKENDLLNSIVKDAMLQAQRKFDVLLMEYLKTNLSYFGFNFSSNNEFLSFAKERIQRVTFEDSTKVEYYLDFVDEENRGNFIGITNEGNVSFENDGYNFKINIG